MTDESYWTYSADAAYTLPTLTGDLQSDVVVIGGGITGLSAALHLAEMGLAAVVLDAESPGWGSSGRSGGFVSPRFMVSFHDMARTHGTQVAQRMYRIGQEAVDCVEETTEKLGLLSSQFRRCGAVMGAHDERALAEMGVGISWMREEYGDPSYMLSRDEVRHESGSRDFVGGALLPNAGSIHPLNYVRGLVGGLVKSGIPVFQNSVVRAIHRDGSSITAETAGGRVRARQIIFATNAYSNMSAATRSIASGVIPFRSSLIATGPMPDSVCDELLPTRRSVDTSKRVLQYYRITDRRLIFGGRGAFLMEDDSKAYARLWADALKLLPSLADYPIEFKWSGVVALTLDQFPHIGQVEDRVWFAGGFNGCGVSMGTLFGKYLAKLVGKQPVNLALLAVERFRRGQLPQLHKLGVEIVTRCYELLDYFGR
jgi:gamma-glutamylputrescine oxidase